MRHTTPLFCFVLLSFTVSGRAQAGNLTSGGPASSTGELTQQLTLPLPPGVGGVEPSISLIYGHRGGMGELGFGWSMPISAVLLDRSTPDPIGRPRWRLDGVELVPGKPGELLPRIDDGRTVVPISTPQGQGFAVYDRSGWTFEYGLGGGLNAECFHTQAIAPVCLTLEARLTRVIDPHGLAVLYEYGAPGSPEETDLQRIRWTIDTATGAPVGPERSLEVRRRLLPAAWVDHRLRTREQAHVIDALDVLVDHHRVRTIALGYEPTDDGGAVLAQVEEIAGGDAPERRLWRRFDYAPDGLNWSGWEESAWTAPDGGAPSPECAGLLQVAEDGAVSVDRFDLTADGISDLVWTDDGGIGLCTADLHLASGMSQDPSWTVPGEGSSSPGLTALSALRDYGAVGVDSEFLDFDGDGHLDRVRRGCQKGWDPSSGVPCMPHLWLERRIGWMEWASEQDVTPAGADVRPEAARAAAAAPNPSRGEVVGLSDLTGDGLPDWVEVDEGAKLWLVWRNSGGAFSPQAEPWPMPMPDLSWTPNMYATAGLTSHDALRGLVDLTGDGIVDAVQAQADCGAAADRYCPWSVQPGNGYGFERPVEFEIPFLRDPGASPAFPLSRIHPPMCATFAGDPNWSPCRWPDPADDLRGVHLTDLDGDGLSDLVFGDEVAFNVAGRRFAQPVLAGLPSEGPYGSGPVHSHAADEIDGRYQDHDGDGFVDWVGTDGWHAAVDHDAPRLPPHVMTGAELPGGGRVQYGYEAAVGFAAETSRRLPGESEPVGPLWVLASVVFSEGDVGDLLFDYRNPVASGRRFQGFEEVTTTAADGSATATTFLVGLATADLAGLVAQVETRAPDGSTLSLSETKWEQRALPAGRVRVRATANVQTLFGTGAKTSSGWTATHDALGRPERRVRIDADGQVRSTSVRRYRTSPHPRHPHLDVDLLDSLDVYGPTTRLDSMEFDFDPATGDLLQRRRFLDTDQALHAEGWIYDRYGYPTDYTDVAGALTTVRWSPDYLRVEASTEVSWPSAGAPRPGVPLPLPVQHVQVATFDAATGTTLRMERRNGSHLVSAARQRLDRFGRVEATSILSPDGSAWLDSTEVEWAPDHSWREVRERRFDENNNPAGVVRSREYLDPFGRTVQVRATADDHNNASVRWVERDAIGRVVRRSFPIIEPGFARTAWGAGLASELAYGADGRTLTAWTSGVSAGDPDDRSVRRWDVPVPGEVVIARAQRHSATVDAWDEVWLDAAGRVDRLVDPEGNETSYAYDEAGRMVTTWDAAGNATWVGYDSWGRRTWLADPDLSQCTGAAPYDPRDCPMTFRWNVDGTLAAQEDAMGRRQEWGHDELGRVGWASSECGTAPSSLCGPQDEENSFYFYDGFGTEPGHGPWELGGLTHVIDPSGWTDWRRDRWGRVQDEARVIGNSRFDTSVSLDSWGLVHDAWASARGTVFEPLHYEYDSTGGLAGVVGAQSGVDWVSSVSMDPVDGQLLGWESLAGRVTHDFEYGADRRLRAVLGAVMPAGTPGPRLPMVDLELGYDAAGRIRTKSDLLTASSETFGYDLLGRLKRAGGPTAGYERDVDYDAIGNILWNSAWLDAGRADYAYSRGAGPHAVRSIGTHSGFDYDESGAVSARWRTGTEAWSSTYRYAADGRLRSTTRTDGDTGIETTTSGVVDAFKRRVARAVEVDGVPTSQVLRPNQQIELRDGVAVRTIWAGGQRIAETSAPLLGPGDTATFFWEDHQGQQVAAVEVGNLLSPTLTVVSTSRVRRDPWGGSLGGDESLLTRAASGGEQEAGGETFLGWRLYDPAVGKFLQPDTLSSGAGQGLNRYRYGWNSPSNFTDPSGHWEVPLAPPAMGRMAGVVAVAAATGPMGSGVLAGPVARGIGLGISEEGSGPMWSCAAGACFVAGMGVGAAGNDFDETEWELYLKACKVNGQTEAECRAEYDAIRSGGSKGGGGKGGGGGGESGGGAGAGGGRNPEEDDPLRPHVPDGYEVHDWDGFWEYAWVETKAFAGNLAMAVGVAFDVINTPVSPGPDATVIGAGTRRAIRSGVAKGRWTKVVESMPKRARAFQARVTGRVGEAFVVGGVKFDGFIDGVLLEVKGPGYANFVKNGEFANWFQGAEELVEQARRQLRAAGGTPIRWHFAEESAAEATRSLFNRWRIAGIDIVVTP